MDLPRLVASNMLDISSCCRVCMKADCSLLSLFNHMIVEQQVLLVAEVLMNCTGLKVSQGDSLPQHICGDCAKTLETMCAFRIRALISESEFRKLVNSTVNEVKDEVIKSEMKQEQDDNIGNMDMLLEDLSEYCPLDFPKQECDSQNLDTLDSQSERYNCDQCSKKYTKKHKFIKHLKSHESPMYCDICKKVFYSKKTLNRHITKHSSELYKCDFCEEVFTSEAVLFEHVVNHTNEANVKCPKCDIIFSRKHQFVAHLRKVHKICNKRIQKQKLTQKLVTTKLSTKALLKRHMNLHSEDQPYDSHPTQYEKCSKSYSQETDLLQHMNGLDGIKSEYDSHFNVDDHDNDEDVSKKIKCEICKKEFATKSLLNRHMKLHSEERPFECTKCTKSYSRQDQLLQHMKWHDGIKPYICSYCSKAFNQLCSLKDHIRIHTGETPYLCSECGKSFTNSSNLRQHLMRHSGVKPFTCNLCPKSFTTKGQMTAHMTTHTGAHPHKCEECGGSFTKANSLKKHKLIHLGVKPFACDTCNMRFSCKEHLKRHTRIHTGEKPYKCQFCERAFTQSNDLAKHLRTHVGQNIYQCTVCSMRFRLISELKQHYPTHYVTGDQAPKVSISRGVEAPVLMLKPQEPTVDALPELKHMDNSNPRITITINSNGLDKNGLAGDITINLSPEKS